MVSWVWAPLLQMTLDEKVSKKKDADLVLKFPAAQDP